MDLQKNPRLFQDKSDIPFRSMDLRILGAILVVSAVFTLMATAIQLYSDYNKDLELLEERIKAVEKTHLPALSLAIWSLDSTLIETQLAGLVSLPDVDSAELFTQYGETFTEHLAEQDANYLLYFFEIYNDESRTYKLGDLTVKSDRGRIHQRQWDRVLVILITNGIRTLFVSIAILAIVRLMVTRHLAKIAEHMSCMRLSKLGQPVNLERKPHPYRDELDVFVSVVNRMFRAFEKDVQLLEEMRDSLKKSEETYCLAMEATQDGLWDWDIESGSVYYSPGWITILGIDQAENHYETWVERIHPDDSRRVISSLEHHLSGSSEIWEAEHRLRNTNGEWIWVLGRGQVVKRSPKGKAKRMIGTMRNIQSRKQSEHIIWHQANYDELTGLPNRKLFLELLNQEIRNAERNNKTLWLLFLDLDGFKEVNDTLGHNMGDQLLKAVGARMQHALRRADIVARLGGDEFVIAIPHYREASGIDHVATKLVQTISNEYVIDNEAIHITSSIGIANYPNDAADAHELLKFADQSMYAAKEAGKSRFVYFTPAMQSASLLRKQLCEDMRQGMQQNRFLLYFQPIVDLASQRVVKAEVLLRWNHPEHGIVSPGAFIPIAEETGLIIDLGTWILEQALYQLQQWHQVDSNLQLSINISPLQMRSENNLTDLIMSQLEHFSLQGNNIVIEITEGLLLDCDQSIKEKLLTYHAAGIQVAIDDFGTGYSSLSYLKEFDIDYLKIDQSFTQNLVVGSTETTISKAIIAMAHELDLMVVAEGIETEDQLAMLTEMGCNYGQGFLFSRPLPADEFERQFLPSARA